MTVASEGPAYTESSVKAVGPVGVKVCRSERLSVAAQPIELMLRRTYFEVFRQLKADPNRTIVGNRPHGSGVGELRDIPSKAEFRFEKQKKMPRWGSAQWLKLNVSTVKIARIGRAGGSSAAGTGRLRKHAAAEIRLVVRRSHGEIRVTADPVMREKCPRLRGKARNADRVGGVGLSARSESRNGQRYGQTGENSLHEHSPGFRRASSCGPAGEELSGIR
jgi:hypothetical protein